MVGQNSLELFNRAAKELPGYKKFLLEHDFKPDSVKSLKDFDSIPQTSKHNYLKKQQLTECVWPVDLKGPLSFCSTSGSTGEPFYFPRNDKLAWQASFMTEEFLKQSSNGQGPTLVLMGLGMGVWIGGLITLRAFEIAAERMHAPVAFLSPGYNKVEIFKALKMLSPQFEQTILVGYPPFIKELLDEAEGENINLKKLNLRLMFAAEAFTETFRNYVCEKAGIKDGLRDTLNIYGTADIGAMAYETPLSILVRKLAIEDPLLYVDMFKQIEKTPTLTQYNPDFIEFESSRNQLLVTGDAAVPLIRYAIGDHGGVFTYDEMERLLKRYGFNLQSEMKKAGIESSAKKRPFVYVYERTDLSATLHGIIIYPEFVKEGLLRPEIASYFTERFTMSTKHDIHHNQFLQINLELNKDIEITDELEQKALENIRKALVQKSSEFAEVSKSKSGDTLIQIVLWPNKHKRYFAPGTKQKWVEKQ